MTDAINGMAGTSAAGPDESATGRRSGGRRVVAASGLAVATVALSLAATSASASAAHATTAVGTGCAAVETIVVRGTGETPQAPYIGKQETTLAPAITAGAAATVETYGLPYPASVSGPLVGGDYSKSEPVGRTSLVARITSQATACPDQKFVIVGYSQGAWVVGDVLSGTGIAPLPTALGSKIAAVVLYGDPFFNAKETYNRGSFTAGVSSPNPRRTGAMSAYADRIADFCNATDPICQKGASGTGHDHYLDTYTADAAKFVVDRLPAVTTVTPVTAVNFQPAGVSTPAGFVADTGAAFDTSRGFGWVRQDSLSATTGTHTGLDLSGNTRAHVQAGDDVALNTLIQMQHGDAPPPRGRGTNTPGAWEYTLAPGTYQVSVSVGAAASFSSINTLNVEGVTAIDAFKPTAAKPFASATTTVQVSDGRLTIDAIGGKNTKLDYVKISKVTTTRAAKS